MTRKQVTQIILPSQPWGFAMVLMHMFQRVKNDFLVERQALFDGERYFAGALEGIPKYDPHIKYFVLPALDKKNRLLVYQPVI